MSDWTPGVDDVLYNVDPVANNGMSIVGDASFELLYASSAPETTDPGWVVRYGITTVSPERSLTQILCEGDTFHPFTAYTSTKYIERKAFRKKPSSILSRR
jgi:hypothetical protein